MKTTAAAGSVVCCVCGKACAARAWYDVDGRGMVCHPDCIPGLPEVAEAEAVARFKRKTGWKGDVTARKTSIGWAIRPA